MDKKGHGPSSGGRSFQDTEFQRKLEAARARRMKVLAERGETMPASGPSTGAAVPPTVMRNLRKAIGQAPLDAEDDPDPEPVTATGLAPRSEIETPRQIAAPGPFPAPAGAPLAPAPLHHPVHVAPPAQPALSFSFVAVLLAAAGIGLTFDKDAFDRMGGEANAAIAHLLETGGAAAPASEPVSDTTPVIALTQAPSSVEDSPAPTGVAGLVLQPDAAERWKAPSERASVAMPPLTGRVDLVPSTPYETASNGTIGALTSVQDAVGGFDQTTVDVIADTTLPILVAPAPRAKLASPDAMVDPDPNSGSDHTQIELASLAPTDPALELAAQLQPLAPELPALLDTDIDALTTPRASAVPRPQARPVLLAASKAPLARPQIDLTIPPSQLVELGEGQSGATADRPLFVHIPGREEASLFDDVLVAIRRQITPYAEARPVPFKVSNAQVRFYHDEDRDSAAAIAKVLDVRLHDLTNFRPEPKRGLIEVWVQGTDVTPVAATPRRQARQPRRTAQRNTQVRRQPTVQPAPVQTEPTLPASAFEPSAIGSAVEAALQAATPSQAAPKPGRVTATVRSVPASNGTVAPQEGVRVRRVQVAPEASRSPVRRLFNSWGSQNVTTIEQFSRENSD